MRKGHLFLIFCILFGLCFVRLMVEYFTFQKTERGQELMDNALSYATECGAVRLAESHNQEIRSQLSSVSVEFFDGLAHALSGSADYSMMPEELSMYVPVLLITDTDGFYIGSATGTKELRTFSELLPYMYEDNSFYYVFGLDDRVQTVSKASGEKLTTTYKEVSRSVMLQTYYSGGIVFTDEDTFRLAKLAAVSMSIEKEINKAVAEHNQIAKQFGVRYEFSCPAFFDEFTPALTCPTITAVFQGFPVTGVRNVYSYCTGYSAATTVRKGQYVVELPLPDFSRSHVAVFHDRSCAHIGEFGEVLDEGFSRYAAVNEYGAYKCPYCLSDLVGLPDIPDSDNPIP